MNTTQTLACNSNWLETGSGAMTQTGTTVSYGSTDNCVTTAYYPWWGGYYHYTLPTEARPIKLTLSEVEKLRKAAKADKALKAILSKFTAQIEITVDFD